MGRPHGENRRGRAVCALHRPPIHPRGDLAGGFRGVGQTRDRGRTSRAGDGHRRPQHTNGGSAPADSRGAEPPSGGNFSRQLCRSRYRAFRHGSSAAGNCAYHRSGAGFHPARHDNNLRRQPHLDAWGSRRRCLRSGHLGGRNGACKPMYHPVQAPGHAHNG